jgi:putative Holliday junction resolvase
LELAAELLSAQENFPKYGELLKGISQMDQIIAGAVKKVNGGLTEEFAEKLRNRTGLEVILWDERLTTVAAHQILDLGDVKLKDRKKVVDKIAAVLILQGYLDLLSLQRKNQEDSE